MLGAKLRQPGYVTRLSRQSDFVALLRVLRFHDRRRCCEVRVDDREHFSLPYFLVRACHKDAVRLCNAPKTVQETEQRTEIQRKLEYHCMYKHYKDDKIQIDIATVSDISAALLYILQCLVYSRNKVCRQLTSSAL